MNASCTISPILVARFHPIRPFQYLRGDYHSHLASSPISFVDAIPFSLSVPFDVLVDKWHPFQMMTEQILMPDIHQSTVQILICVSYRPQNASDWTSLAAPWFIDELSGLQIVYSICVFYALDHAYSIERVQSSETRRMLGMFLRRYE